MATSVASKGVYLARVVENVPLCREHWRFTLAVENFPAAAPGQFVQILCAEPGAEAAAPGLFLRRPFSIGGLRRDGRRTELDILHRAIGPGTVWLSRLAPGDRVSVIGPLGVAFRLEADRPLACLVGGGIGLPPLIWLAELLRGTGHWGVAFCGARRGDLLPLTRVPGLEVLEDQPAPAFLEFAEHDVPVLVSTDDGSLGAAGLVPEVFARYLDEHPNEASAAAAYTCGPEPMMAAVARICEERGIPCQVCLERMMACGMGTCQSCVVRVRDEDSEEGWRYRLCCTEGPVFNSRTVFWV